MDRHDIVQPLLTDYVLDELDSPQRREVEQHLQTCDACASEARELAQAFQSIGQAPRADRAAAAPARAGPGAVGPRARRGYRTAGAGTS